MAKKTRLNDTVAIEATAPYSLGGSESRSINVRKIDNGYVTTESSCKDGRYESKDTYSATPPKLGEDMAENPMQRAANYLKRNGTT